MPKFEVFIPPASSEGFNVTFRVDANNWMAALRIGLMKLGQQGATAQNILVDIQDDSSVHVTESETGRVFRIKELSDLEAAEAKQKPGTEALIDDRADTPREMPAVGPDPQQASTAPAVSRPVFEPIPSGMETVPEQRATLGRHEAKTVVSPAAPELTPSDLPTLSAGRESVDVKKTLPPGLSLKPAQPPAHKPSAVSKMRKSSIPSRAGTQELMPDKVIELEKPTKPVSGVIGRTKSAKDRKAELEDVLADVFERVQEIYAKKGADDALYFLLDLALEKIPGESGSVFKADAGSGDLTFWAARGPKAKDVLDAKIRVPAGTGIVGFCATEGVSVALSDVQKDPRFYSAVSSRVHYETRSVICSPMMTHGRTFGAMQIINRTEGAKFAEYEVGLLSYIAHQGALYLNTVA